jgi:hypothetical protein
MNPGTLIPENHLSLLQVVLSSEKQDIGYKRPVASEYNRRTMQLC